MLEIMYELKHLISVTQENYQLLYVDLLQRAQVWMQSQQKSELLESNLQLAIAVLKHRRAYMLPIGANAETCYQQQDVWTYALFTAALLRHEKLEQVEVLLPTKGWQWLQHFGAVFQQWSDFFEGRPQANNVIAAILQKTEAALLNQPMTTDNEGIAALFYSTIRTTDRHEQNKKQASDPEQPVSPTANEFSVLLSQEAQQEEQEKIETKDVTSTVETNASDPSKEYATSDEELTSVFINWLKQALVDGTIAINQLSEDDHGAIHHVAEGILLVMPDSWDLFLASNPDIPDNWQALTHSKYTFIKTVKQSFIHTYYAGDWQKRRVIKGLLVKPTYLFTPYNLPALNKQLILDV